ncbi:hypothetical protein B566_EDAN016074 [Ephemera danica]|nr:hypothetical protein B566_EDAN016074 [Ephemera danica]
MQSITVVFIVGIVALASAYPADEEKYTTKWDSVDLDQILASERLLNNYIKCLLETGNCTPDGSDLKRILPDALETECSKCSEKQKTGSEKVLHHLIKNKPDTFKELEANRAGRTEDHTNLSTRSSNMQVYCVSIVLALLSVAIAAPQEETYTTKWDNIDLDKILGDEAQLKNYFDCIMEQGPCTEEGAELKKLLPEALTTNCAKCSAAQKSGLEKVIIFLLKNRPEHLKQLAIKLDPLGIFKSTRPEIVSV